MSQLTLTYLYDFPPIILWLVLKTFLDVSRQTVSKWETGESIPDFNKIKPICEYFGITTDELITGSQNIVEQKERR